MGHLSDWLAVGVAVSLPWSTSGTGILVVLWLVTVLPALRLADIRRELLTPAGGLPVLLWLLAFAGLFWADASWRERLGGFDAFHRLLVIPLLLARFRQSERGLRVLGGFFISVSVLLLFSWALALFPKLPWHSTSFGVPVKDYILQSDEFLMCAFALLGIACDLGRAGRWRSAILLVAFALCFLANIAFVATGRTTLLVAPVLMLLLGWRQYRWRGLVGAALLFCVIGGAVGFESPYLRGRLKTSLEEWRTYQKSDALNSTSLHLEFVRKSIKFVETAPIIGHGTGTIGEEFRQATIGRTGVEGAFALNPHNQILAVAVQLGLVGAAIVLAMWVAHFMLFRGSGPTAWIGLIVVTENVVSSLVNSHLFDFTQAWLYVFGVGVAGGMALRRRSAGGHESDPAAV